MCHYFYRGLELQFYLHRFVYTLDKISACLTNTTTTRKQMIFDTKVHSTRALFTLLQMKMITQYTIVHVPFYKHGFMHRIHTMEMRRNV